MDERIHWWMLHGSGYYPEFFKGTITDAFDKLVTSVIQFLEKTEKMEVEAEEGSFSGLFQNLREGTPATVRLYNTPRTATDESVYLIIVEPAESAEVFRDIEAGRYRHEDGS